MTTDLKKVCAKELAKLMPGITTAMKAEAERELPISRPTLDKYLKGDIVKVETATKLIRFFRNKIKEAMAELQGAA